MRHFTSECCYENSCGLSIDLPGRGYSSAPSPDHHPQSSTFFTDVILYVLASSPLAWTGPASFAAVGYSLDGGFIVNFASCFGSLITSFVLLAPSGLIRPYHFGWQSRLLYSGNLIPDWIREALVSWRLRTSDDSGPQRSDSSIEEKLPGAEWRLTICSSRTGKCEVTEVP